MPRRGADGQQWRVNGVLAASRRQVGVPTEAAATAGAPLAQPTIRSEFADTALWAAALETNKDGIAEAELDMPQNLTTWKIRAWGMGRGTRVGEASAEVVTRKNRHRADASAAVLRRDATKSCSAPTSTTTCRPPSK